MKNGIAWWLGLLAASLAAGCVNIDVESKAKQFYVLQDTGRSQCQKPPGSGALLIDVLTPAAFYNANTLAFSKGAGSRGYYQYAQWTDRPANQIGLLVRDRLRQGCLYRQVALSGEGLTGEQQLSLRLLELYHDVSSSPGQAVIELDVQLIRRDAARLIAQKTFRVTAPAAGFDAKGAAAGMNQALTRLLDELAAWLAQQPRG
ncbi:MAG: membrane integrity-associated transporter subunit PqiC [Hydrogenophilaceae bacterium]|nr:membrane integrity-associated transporter subunit PqiC [Hydrogenophilaceae bacterium]